MQLFISILTGQKAFRFLIQEEGMKYLFLLRYLFIQYDNILRISYFREIDQTAASRECIENAG